MNIFEMGQKSRASFNISFNLTL